MATEIKTPTPSEVRGMAEPVTEKSLKGTGIKKKAKTGGQTDSEKASPKAKQLLDLCAGFELFHSPDGSCYASFKRDKFIETVRLESRNFELLLLKLYRDAYNDMLSEQQLKPVIRTLQAEALISGEEKEIHLRTARDVDDVIIDLGTSDWQQVRVTKKGWQLERSGNQKFWRPSNQRPLAIPIPGTGNLEMLRTLLNVDDQQWILLRAFLVQCLLPSGEYPILVAQGGEGTAKSTLCKVLKVLLDNHSPPLRRLPTSPRDLAVFAKNAHVLAFDNLSGITAAMSDELCSIATGGGFGAKQNYTDADDHAYEFARPVIINGIDDLAKRQDFLSRSVILRLEKIADDKRIRKSVFWESFEESASAILSGLLDLLSLALGELDSVYLAEAPRMADFAHLGVAIEKGLKEQAGSFMHAYKGAQEAVILDNLQYDPFAVAVVELMDELARGEGSELEKSPSNLHGLIEGKISDRYCMPKQNKLGERLERINTALNLVGIRFLRPTRGSTRLLKLQRFKKLTP
ncbi:MAG: hypothetical protein IPG59_00910 [Candidatus Melainabacteria bacterium]|nr:MAG: hypothetical protein IPG59_00910 [Candidatus Melainabacteria bacterium]